MTIIAGITLFAAIAIALELIIGGRSLPELTGETPIENGPKVSIIFSALDEGPNVEAAVRSLLALQYANVEIIAIDDRSTDDTGDILDELAEEDPRIRVVHVTSLPARWLGKNHALHKGAALATGEWLLFTDADIVFEPDSVGRAMGFVQREKVDHLALAPGIEIPTAPLALVVNFFTVWFAYYYKPWLATKTKTARWHMGVGAFNLVRADLYRRMGGHEHIALRPDDDLKLGKLVKLNGGRQVVSGGKGLINVRWYANLGELLRGFRKNAFAGLEYSVALALVAVIAQLAFNVWPFVALFVLPLGGIAWSLNFAAAIVLMSPYGLVAVHTGDRPWLALLYPVAALIFTYIIAAATVRTLLKGGIEWRGTFYPLDLLRKNRV